jgi:Putative beta-barrel porin-2, OmpL-like. bbp2
MTKVNKWTLGLAAVGLVSLPAMVQAEEKPNQLLTALSSTTLSGYIDTSAQWTLGSGNANPPGYSYNTPAKQDGFNLNVVDLQLEKPLDEGTWSAGYKAELWFGPNSAGLGNDSGLGGGGNDVAIKQAYVALRAPLGNGLDIKIGTWDTIIGYEVANSGSNPNYTRSYGYTYEPTSQSGVLASYQVNKVVGFSGGVANLWSPGIGGGVDRSPRSESKKSYLGSITLTAPDSWGDFAGSALYAGIVDGYNAGFVNDVTSYYLGVTIATPIKALKVGAAWDYVAGHDNSYVGSSALKSNNGYAQSIALYASVQATEKLSFHARGEWAKLSFGNNVGTPETAPGEDDAVLPSNNGTQEIWALTGTIQYDLWANVLSRLEVRWDHASSHDTFGGTTSGEPRKQNEVIVAANVIYKF